MPTSHLIALIDLPCVGNPNTNGFGDSRLHVIAVLLRQYAYVDNLAVLPVRNSKAGVFYVTSLLTEDGSQELFFSGQFSLTLGCDLADQNVARCYPCANSNDSFIVEVSQALFTNVRNVTSNFFRSEFRLSGFNFVFVDVYRCVAIVFHEVFVEDDCVFVVEAIEGHETNKQVLSKRKLTVVS